jgi:hypothetical protein
MNMKNKLLYQHHIMWYESKMINETLDSLQQAISVSPIDVDLKFCLNSQTYLETPIQGNSEDMFGEFINHPILKNAEIIYKTDSDPFYNIGDWRREVYDSAYKYTIWGESDCLIPVDYFYILSNLHINGPHLLTCASRIMWDDTWEIVEHVDLKKFPNLDSQRPSNQELIPFRYYDYISQFELNEFNDKFNIEIQKIDTVKIDGSLLAISYNIPNPFIPYDMNFVREDFCAQQFFIKKNIPQYVISTRLKGHNYHHPLKRENTMNRRSDIIYKKMEHISITAMNNFLKNL